MYALKEGLIVQSDFDSDFLQTSSTQAEVRNRTQLTDPLMKKPEMISPSEYRLAIQTAVERCLTISQENYAVEVARSFGYNKTSASYKKTSEHPNSIYDQRRDDQGTGRWNPTAKWLR